MSSCRSFSAVFCLSLAALATPLLPSRAAAQDTQAVQATSQEQPQRRDRNRLSEEEIRTSPQSNRDMLEVVRSSRPHWLRGRGDQSFSGNGSVRVYIDGMVSNGIEELRRLDPQSVKSAQYLSASTATIQYGTDHQRGAILIFTR